jgi:hypothetical protein
MPDNNIRPAIDSYAFGRIVIGGTPYTSDLIIFPDNRIVSPWWRLSGHWLLIADIMDLLASGPEVLVAGTGAAELMRPAGDLQELLAARGIDFIAEPSGKASRNYPSQYGKEGGGLLSPGLLTARGS